jgi:hypothetical protein
MHVLYDFSGAQFVHAQNLYLTTTVFAADVLELDKKIDGASRRRTPLLFLP